MRKIGFYAPPRPASRLLLTVLLASALGLTGCQQEGSAEKAGKAVDKTIDQTAKQLDESKASLGAKADQAGIYMDDSAITGKIKAEIIADPVLKVAQINVTTTHGAVVLTGALDSQQSIDRAMQIARSNPAAKSVQNSLILKSAK